MLADCITPFVDSSKKVLDEFCRVKAVKGTAYQKKDTFEGDSIVVLIGVVGEMKGQIIFSMNEEAALYLAYTMMGGADIEKLTEMAKSAIAELANIISGNAMTIFSSKNIKMGISPPTIFTGKGLNISISKAVIIAIPMLLSNKLKFEINVVLS